jgi:signal transduction histidine kinase/CheY-like chemotaxis protein
MGTLQRRKADVTERKSVETTVEADVRDIKSVRTTDDSSSSERSDIEKGEGGTLPDQKALEGAPSPRRHVAIRRQLIPALILAVGAGACAIILGVGISAARTEQEKRFERLSEDVVHEFSETWEQYTTVALWLRQAAHSGKQTREEFHDLYEYLVTSGLNFKSIAYSPNVTHAERAAFEDDTRTFMEESYPEVPRHGFTRRDNTTLLPHFDEPQPFYYPAHFVEPVEENWHLVDLDVYVTPHFSVAVKQAATECRPILTELIPCVVENSVAIFHPGIQLSSDHGIRIPHAMSMLAVGIPSLMAYVAARVSIEKAVSVYLYDSTRLGADAQFLGGAMFPETTGRSQSVGDYRQPSIQDPGQSSRILLFPKEETDLKEGRRSSNRIYEGRLSILSREWTIVVEAEYGTFRPVLGFVILGSTMIFVACACLALWMLTSYRRETKIYELRSAAEADKAAMMVENAHMAAKAERELNDFIAHEVRNPLSAAISATSFVSSVVSEANPLSTADTRQSAREDVRIIEASLQFINDLLRNMLDMHRASSNQLKIEMAHADLLRDVLEPVASMLYHRCDDFEVLLDCPQNLVIMTDRLRLKQIVLNLGRNAAKFVEKGFVRLRADVVDGMVQVYVEDSGPGIPLEKRKRLFCKFQESLDSLNQGTGIGLCVCQNLIDLMHGEITLDEHYESGIEGSPGSRFVIKLNTLAIQLDSDDLETDESSQDETEHIKVTSDISSDISLSKISLGSLPSELPEKLSVLFVDDDMLLRKLFSRSIRKIMPTWQIQEAGNGETALRLVDENQFDLIFMDQYMASADKQLLGTETVRALRAKGVTSRICGLSANDLKKPFLRNGANAFLIKPFPCAKEALTRELLKILYEDGEQDDGGSY